MRLRFRYQGHPIISANFVHYVENERMTRAIQKVLEAAADMVGVRSVEGYISYDSSGRSPCQTDAKKIRENGGVRFGNGISIDLVKGGR